MEEIDSSPASPNPKKRAAQDEEPPANRPLNVKGTQFMMPTPPDTDHSSTASPSCTNNADTRQASPTPSSSALSSVEVVSSNPVQSSTTTIDLTSSAAGPSASGPPPAKRRKLTPSEKLQKQKEKDAKDAEKAEQKAKREEEKRVKDEGKRKKAEEREAKKREKELEEEQKAQEKLKKERAQMRLGVYFQKPATPAKPASDGEETHGSARRKSLSLEPFEAVADQIRSTASPCKGAASPVPEKQTPAKVTVSEYQKYFLPFQLHSYSSIAPVRMPDNLDAAQEAFDLDVSDPSIQEKYDLGLVDSYASLERHFANHRGSSRGRHLPSMRQLVDQVQGSVQQPIDLTDDVEPRNPMEVLQAVSRRYLEFDEDVRPAYFGTYTKIRSPRSSKTLCRNPFSRTRKDTDYDYDSEAEWDEPEEGEELLDEDDEEAESQGDAHEMDEFLDDEESDAVKSKRKMITGDLVPTCTGLCWEDEHGKIMSTIEGGSPSKALRGMRMGILLSSVSGTTIDPFSTAYWQSEPASAAQLAPLAAAEPSATPLARLMAPPRPPLQPRPNSNGTLDHVLVGAAQGMKGPITSAATPGAKPGRKPAPKTLSKEDLDEFKDAVVGSQISKVDLTKGLKSRYACPCKPQRTSCEADNVIQVSEPHTRDDQEHAG